MLGFLPTVIAVTVFGRLIMLAMPRGGTIYKYLSVIFMLCVSAVVILPVADLVSSVDGIFNVDLDGSDEPPDYYESIFEEGIADSLYPSVEEYIYRKLKSEFSVSREDCEVGIVFNTRGDVIAIERITILLKNGARFKDTARISRYFEEELVCIADVSVDLP